MIPFNLLYIGLDPFASGSFGDVYRGTLDGAEVCVKRVRVYAEGDPVVATGVRWTRRFPVLHY